MSNDQPVPIAELLKSRLPGSPFESWAEEIERAFSLAPQIKTSADLPALAQAIGGTIGTLNTHNLAYFLQHGQMHPATKPPKSKQEIIKEAEMTTEVPPKPAAKKKQEQ